MPLLSMEKRTKIIIIVTIIFLIFVLIVIVALSIGGDNINNSNKNINDVGILITNTIYGRPNINLNLTPTPITQEPKTEAVLKTAARTFAERFGSYSNESNYENLKDLQSMMTAKMRAWTDDYITQNPLSDSEFFGITTKALSIDIITINDNETQAQIVVNTQRLEKKGDADEPTVYYQQILISLVRENEQWKVDQANWQ